MRICFTGLVLLYMSMPPAIAGSESVDTFAPFGAVHLYRQFDSVATVTLFISGDGGWNLGVVSMAKTVAATGSLVVGIDIRGYIRHLNSLGEKCCYPPAEFENLSKYIQKKSGLPVYHPPIVIGYSSGATLAYALIAQAPHGTFAGALSMGFCPDLPVTRPFCRQYGLRWHEAPRGRGVVFEPDSGLTTPWIAFQGQIDRVCSPEEVDFFVKSCGSTRVIALPGVGHGFSVEKNWVPQFRAAFDSLVPSPREAATTRPAAVGDLPLVELPAKGACRVTAGGRALTKG
jgi:type IV secretory pathway VirJ component